MARLTSDDLRRKGIDAPKEYLEELRRAQRKGRRARSPAALDSQDSADGEDRALDMENVEDHATTPLYGGGALIFDEYGRLKYHVHNDVFGKKRQAERLRYLWETGQLEAGSEGARFRPARLSTIHRMRAVDARRFPAQGW